MENAKQKIAKIYELVKRGATDGEKAAAQRMLDKMLKKYKLEGIDLECIDHRQYTIKYNSQLELELLSRIVFVLMGNKQAHNSAYRQTNGVRHVVFTLTYIDYVTLSCSYEYFRKHMNDQWRTTCQPIIKKCRKTTTKNKKRKALQLAFKTEYFIKSKLVLPEEVKKVDLDSMSNKEYKDRVAVAGVKGGQYNRQVVTGNLIEN